jgi:hypothetical protein
MTARRDRIEWRQIMVGYLVCACVLAAMASALLLPEASQTESRNLSALVVVAGAVLVALLKPLLRRLHGALLAPRPRVEAVAKGGAVALLCLLSVATSAAGGWTAWQFPYR